MIRSRKIVGLGEAVIIEYPDRREVGGLAARIATAAVKLGHVGVVVSRIGQDEPGEALLELLQNAGADCTHVQTDPDLATGRVIVRPGGQMVRRYAETPAAFDNLQADFDLEDVGQQADAVVFGVLTRRGGQTRAEEDRFIETSAAAWRVYDATNREDLEIGRGHVQSGMRHADAVILDLEAARYLVPSASTTGDAADRLLVSASGLSVVIATSTEGDVDNLSLHTRSGSADGAVSEAERDAFLIRFIDQALAKEQVIDAFRSALAPS